MHTFRGKMRRLISTRTSGNVLLALFALLAAFHIVLLFNLLPSSIVWGGRAGSSSALPGLLTISLIFNFLFAIAVAVKIGYIKVAKDSRVINSLLWLIFAYLLLNTAGNFLSNSSFEKLLFTPITIVAAFLVFRLAIEK